MASLPFLLIAAVLAVGGSAFASADPFKPIVVVNSFPANGSADIVGRSATNKMLKLMTTLAAPSLPDVLATRAGDAMGLALDRIVRIERRAYGRGIPGTDDVVNSPRDGDTLLFGNNMELITQPRLYRLPYAPGRDLVPVAAVARMPIVMIALSQGGPSSVRAFVDAAQAAPGVLNYGSSGDFRSGHLAGELFVRRTGISVVHVSYNGGNDALNSVIKSQVQAAFIPLPSVLPALPGGKIRLLGIADPVRHEALPQVPTLSEAGVPGFEAASWFAIYAPAGTPGQVAMRLNRGMTAGLRALRLERLLASQGLQARYPGASEFGALMRAEEEKWKPVLDGMEPPY